MVNIFKMDREQARSYNFEQLITCIKMFRSYSQGGITTRDEMCLTFIAYYPRIRMTGCGSHVITAAFNSFLNNGRFTQ